MESPQNASTTESPVSVEPGQINLPTEVHTNNADAEPRESESGRFSEQNLNDSQDEQDDVDDEGPKSSAENIIPLEKLRHGWLAISGFVLSTANKVKTSAVETYNSEQVANMKRRTSEVVAPAWEKTCEVAVPAWERTCEAAAPIWSTTCTTASVAVERTKEGAASLTQTVADRWKLFTAQKAGTSNTGSGDAPDGVDVPPPAPAHHSELDSAPSGPVKGPPTIV